MYAYQSKLSLNYLKKNTEKPKFKAIFLTGDPMEEQDLEEEQSNKFNQWNL